VSRLAIGAAVLTTLDGTTPHGSTGMAWAEGDDPLLLTTLRRDGTTRRLVAETGIFAVSALGAEHAELAWQFARRRDRFGGVRVRTGPVHGLPLLADALAGFECTVEAVHPFGEHEIVVGRIVSCFAAGSGEAGPAVHYRRRLWTVEPA
jgi:3-hydroxy-9,10-secoandrosta-1,3,5(10)-triene-9,17-dione monooxygenase reductase component